MNEHIIAKLEKIRNLPTIPAVIQKLRSTISDPNADAARVSAIIENDPAMMTRILKIVNSAFYGGVEPITSVQHAVARMGFSAISNIALSTFVFSSFEPSEKSVFDRQAFWQHCIGTGIAAEAVYKTARNHIGRRFRQDILHLSGLLHDIGKIVFEQHFHAEFTLAVESAKEDHLPLFSAERKTIGTEHTEVGAWLAAKWKIDPLIQDVIRWHHEPEKAEPSHYDLAAICHIANFICNIGNLGEGGDSCSPELSERAAAHLGIGRADIEGMTGMVQEESEKLNTMLSLA